MDFKFKSSILAALICVCFAQLAVAEGKSCPNSSKPWMESDGTTTSCTKNVDCPGGYNCTDTVCCPAAADTTTTTKKPEGSGENAQSDDPIQRQEPKVQISEMEACGKGGKPFRNSAKSYVKCSADSDCLPPSSCLSTGYCCLMRLNQEPPPVGCPFGTRPLKNSAGSELTCSPGQPGTCPGETQCYQDSVTSTYHCCGKSPGEGCPSGSRAAKTSSNTIINCTPGSVSQGCASNALCQWSYLTDRYQCCEKDNGCAPGSKPLMTTSNQVTSCNTDGSNKCPSGATCTFNFWSAADQCCERDIGHCPVGELPYLEYSTGRTRQCSLGTNVCPTGYSCQTSTNGQTICCGRQGTCPSGQTSALDGENRPTSCTPTDSSICPSGSSCMQSVNGAATGQYQCCRAITNNQRTCSSGRTPMPLNNPQSCTLGFGGQCPYGSQCEASNILGQYICCSTTVNNNLAQCPVGWSIQNNRRQYCNPVSTTCPAGGYCLQSTVSGQFLCCSAGGSTNNPQYTCPIGTPVKFAGDQYQMCGNGQACTAPGSACQQASNAPGTYICCYSQAVQSYTCPYNAIPYRVGSSYQFCSATLPACPAGYVCQPSTNVAGTSICCTSTGGNTLPYTCPATAGTPVKLGNTNHFCNTQASNCPYGSSCQIAANQPSVTICCQGAAAPSYTCPRANSTPYQVGTQVRTCSVFNSNCPTGYECNADAVNRNIYICCSVSNPATYQCPNSLVPYSNTANGAPTFCNPAVASGCPQGTTCMTATNAPQYSICCKSATTNLCPAGQQPLLVGNSQPQYCTSPAGACSAAGYSCQYSVSLGRYICCGSATTSTQCPNGRNPLLGNNGQAANCNPAAGLNACINNYDCVQSTQSTTQYVCCERSLTPTRPTRCASGRQAVFQNGVIRTCSAFGPACSAGETCEASDVTGTDVCCYNSASSAQCPTNWQGYQTGNGIKSCYGLTDSSCPASYQCSQSTIQGSFLCCRFGSGTQLTCYNGQQAYNNGGQPLTCSTANPQCPSGYACQQSSQSGTFICCASGTSSQYQCASGAQVETSGSGSTKFCTTVGSTFQCGANYVCGNSQQTGVNVCCARNVASNVCRPGTVPSLVNGQPRTCFANTNSCPAGYSCLQYNTAQFYCCSGQAQQASVCPNNRNPYRDPSTQAYFYCDSSNYNCPDGYVCKKMTSGTTERYICCSGVPSCQRGWLAYLDPATDQPKTCSTFDPNSCATPGYPYKCQQSTVPNTSLCCMESPLSVDDQPGQDETTTTGPWGTWNSDTKEIDEVETDPSGGGIYGPQIEDPFGSQWGSTGGRPNDAPDAPAAAMDVPEPTELSSTDEENLSTDGDMTVWG